VANESTNTVAANTPISTNGNESTSTSPTASLTTTLAVASTSVGQTTALATSENGQIYTTTVGFTTTIPAGTVVTASSIATVRSSNTNTGAIVGGVVGGVAGLLLLVLLAILCLRRRRRHEFDGNFDPANITSSGGGTLPKIDLGEGGIMGNGGGGGLIEEDDGMGGRLGAGAGGGGIITPYAFVPPAPVGGTGVVGGHQYQHPQMQQVAGDGVGVAAAGYGNEKRPIRLQHTPTASVSSGSHYPASSNPHYQVLAVGSPEPQSPTSDGVSADGSGATYYRQSAGRGGPSPGPSVLSSSSGGGGGGRNAKEMEATGRIVIANPDEGAGQLPGFQQAYLQTGPGPQHQRGLSSSSTNAVRSTSPASSRGAVVVHEDGGRIVLRSKGEPEGEPEVLNTEIPPTYDSLPVDVRREG